MSEAPEITPAQWRDHTQEGRRQARYLAAKARMRKIRDGNPPLTDTQLRDLAAELVLLLRPGGDQ